MDGPQASEPGMSLGHGVIEAGKSLEVLLDFVQLFGAVSLYEAASGMLGIAHDIPVAYVAVVFLCSFFCISILHSVGSTLEVFEGEYTKSWAVLGLTWTANFCGVVLYIISKRARGDTSLPWFAMIAPFIQTVVLVYALSMVAGPSRRIRRTLLVIAVALSVGLAVYIHTVTDIVERCNDVSIYDNFEVPVIYGLEDCVDLRIAVEGCSAISYKNDFSDENPINFFSGSCINSTGHASLLLMKKSTFEDFYLSDNGVAFAVIVVVLIMLAGGSFVSLLVESRLENVGLQRFLKPVVVCGWVVAYPIFEFVRLVPRLRSWAACLGYSLKLREYKFCDDGTITLANEQEWRKHRFAY